MRKYVVIAKVVDREDPDGYREGFTKLGMNAKSKEEAKNKFNKFVEERKEDILDKIGGYNPEIDTKVNVIDFDGARADCRALIETITDNWIGNSLEEVYKDFIKEESEV